MKYYPLLVVVCVSSIWLAGSGVHSLFEDQTGTYDWRQQYVGKPLWSHMDPDGALVHVATDLHVLAALDAHTGKIVWRKLFESGPSGQLVNVFWTSKEIVVVTDEGRKLQSFDYHHGFANWEYLMDQQASNIAIVESTQDTGSFYLSHGSQLCLLNAKEKNCVTVPLADLSSAHLFESEQGVFLVGVKDAKFHKLHYSSTLSSLISNVASEVNQQLSSVECVKSIDYNTLSCFSSSSGVITRLSDIKTGDKMDISQFQASRSVFQEASGSSPKLIWASKDMLVVRVSHDVYIFKREKNENELVLLKRVESTSAFEIIKRESNSNFYLVVAKYSTANKLSFLSFDLKSGQEREDLAFSTQQKEQKTPLLINSRLGDLRNSQLSMNVLVFFEDYSLSVYNSQGARLFTREEALAYITSSEMVPFPLRHLQEEFEDEFGSSTSGESSSRGGSSKPADHQVSVINMFYKRIRTQFIQLNEFITIDLYERLLHFAQNPTLDSLLNYQPTSSTSDGSSVNTIRDEFNLNQIIVAATSIGRVFGLYTGDQGKVLWSFYLKDLASFKSIIGTDYVGLFLQRTGAHVPYEAQCVLVAKHATDGHKTRVFFFNPLNGKAIKEQLKDGFVFDYELKQAFLSNFHDTQYLKPLILFDTQKRMHILPEKSTGEVLSKMGSKLNIIYSADKTGGSSTLTGYAVTSRLDKPLSEVWRVSFEDESIVAVAAKLPNDRIHSQGKVLGDRSVLYKYLNPNLVGVVTAGLEGQKVPIVNIYLIDTITGSIVYSFSHKKCRGPVSIIHSENWFFYSYYNVKNRRNEVTSVELFEGSVQANSSHFSSLEDVKPINFTKSFIANRGFDAMQLTITEKGISNKDVIVAGQFGLIIELPSIFFDARRPLVMTEVHREENLLPYMPEIPLNFEFSLNYYNHVYNVRGITTAPSGLESTSLVFVYGLDLFFTRAFPSKTFDMLREDFDYLFITTLMVGLLAGTFLSKKLAQSSNLKKAWK